MFGVPVFAMKSMLTEKEFLGWVKYFNQKGPDTQEIQMAILMSLVSSGLGGKGKVDDFILSKTPKDKTVTNAQTTVTKGMAAQEVRAAFAGVATPMK
jgi:hypothetical protein